MRTLTTLLIASLAFAPAAMAKKKKDTSSSSSEKPKSSSSSSANAGKTQKSALQQGKDIDHGSADFDGRKKGKSVKGSWGSKRDAAQVAREENAKEQRARDEQRSKSWKKQDKKKVPPPRSW